MENYLNAIFDRGVYLPDIDLWLDSRRKQATAYISHAHTDHVARHQRPMLTEATQHLLKPLLNKSDPHILEYGEPHETPTYSLTLYPAGHCLGSAQVLIESKISGERTLYTGDIKVKFNPTAEPLQPVPCDILIIEATFGHPAYNFPPQETVLSDFFNKLGEWLEDGETPVVLAYRLGKSQELLHHLLSNGFEVALEETIYQVTQTHVDAGVVFPGTFRQFDGKPKDGEILISTPGRNTKAALSDITSKKFMAMSGWAVHKDARWRLGANYALPFSDHADYQELFDYVYSVNPQKIYTVNGFPHLAYHLKNHGYDAEHLEKRQGNLQLKFL